MTSGRFVSDPMLGHRCERIARTYSMAAGRDVWLGRLLEPISGHPEETHCLHVTTPYKTVVFGIMERDTQVLAIFATIMNGDKAINPTWLERQAKNYQLVKDVQQKAQPAPANAEAVAPSDDAVRAARPYDDQMYAEDCAHAIFRHYADDRYIIGDYHKLQIETDEGDVEAVLAELTGAFKYVLSDAHAAESARWSAMVERIVADLRSNLTFAGPPDARVAVEVFAERVADELQAALAKLRGASGAG